MAKRMTQTMLKNLENELLGKHQVKVSELNDFALRLDTVKTYKGMNVVMWYENYKGGWLIIAQQGNSGQHIEVSEDELVDVEVRPYYTI